LLFIPVKETVTKQHLSILPRNQKEKKKKKIPYTLQTQHEKTAKIAKTLLPYLHHHHHHHHHHQSICIPSNPNPYLSKPKRTHILFFQENVSS
jgi:hypothetical protein